MSRALIASILLIACKSSDERQVSDPLADPTVVFEQEPFEVDTDWPDTESDADTDADTDSDTDADTDSDTDADTDTDTAMGQTFDVTIRNVSPANVYSQSGIFNTPVGAGAAGPIGPTESYEVTFSAGPNANLSFATMFIPSNDLFIAPAPAGIPLYTAGVPTEGDITAQLQIWDAGTELNEALGAGTTQPPNAGGADDTDANVRLATDAGLPAVADVINASLVHQGDGTFVLTITNASTATTLNGDSPVPLSPGVWGVHAGAANLFVEGSPEPGVGLEALAEDGSAADLGTAIAAETGLTVPLSPGVWATTMGADPLFTVGTMDAGLGLEAIAEDGDPTALAAALSGTSGILGSGVFNTPVGAGAPAPIGPGGEYTFTVSGEEGDKLSFATMFILSNDLFLGPDGAGIELYAAGVPVSGDVTAQVQLWDAGTEVNQEPGVGPDQAPFQSGPNTGAAEGGNVGLVSDGFTYPAVTDVIQVTITPN